MTNTNPEILVEYWQVAGLTHTHVTEMLNKLNSGWPVLLNGHIASAEDETL